MISNGSATSHEVYKTPWVSIRYECMGYSHYWTHKREFTDREWKTILGETKRIIAKAARGHYYTGKEDAVSQNGLLLDEQGFRHGFGEEGAWRTFPHPEAAIPQRGEPILVAGPDGTSKPRLTKHVISLNGKQPDDYESFVFPKLPQTPFADRQDNPHTLSGFCKTEYRKYDSVVVSILAVARAVAPEAIDVSSDGGSNAIRYLF